MSNGNRALGLIAVTFAAVGFGLGVLSPLKSSSKHVIRTIHVEKSPKDLGMAGLIREFPGKSYSGAELTSIGQVVSGLAGENIRCIVDNSGGEVWFNIFCFRPTK